MPRLILTALCLTAVLARAEERPLNFANDIVPIFTKSGCNAGGCHGKASGQNGFKLSLLGFEPAEDYEHIVKEARGRRVFPAAPDQSLLLSKAVNATPHGGGRKLDATSDEYAILKKWISRGCPGARRPIRSWCPSKCTPLQKTMSLKSEQPLKVIATLLRRLRARCHPQGAVRVERQEHGRDHRRRPREALRSARRCRGDGALPGQDRRLPRHGAAGCARRDAAACRELHRRPRLRQAEAARPAAVGDCRRRHLPPPRHDRHRRPHADACRSRRRSSPTETPRSARR